MSSDTSSPRIDRRESDFQEIFELLLSKSNIHYESQKRLESNGRIIDLYIPEYDAAIELKAEGDQRKGIGQALQYSKSHEEACLMVPEEHYDSEIAEIAVEAEVGYGIVKNEDFQYSLFTTYPFSWIVNSHVENKMNNDETMFSHGALPEAFHG